MQDDVERREYLLVKRGLYWRPDGQGYTGVKELAGRYFERDANPDSGSVAVHESEAGEFSSNCWPEVVIATLQAKLDKAVEGLEWIEKTCREEIPLEYNDGMRKVFQRNIRDAAQSLIKELRP